jgi:copper chaperone CopZ
LKAVPLHNPAPLATICFRHGPCLSLNNDYVDEKVKIWRKIMSETKMTIEGMSCNHCVMRVKKALDQLPGVTESKVEIGSAFIVYDPAKIDKSELSKAVENAGYKVTG